MKENILSLVVGMLIAGMGVGCGNRTASNVREKNITAITNACSESQLVGNWYSASSNYLFAVTPDCRYTMTYQDSNSQTCQVNGTLSSNSGTSGYVTTTPVQVSGAAACAKGTGESLYYGLGGNSLVLSSQGNAISFSKVQ